MLGWVIGVGLLGGLTVKLLTPPPVSVLHTCLAQLVLFSDGRDVRVHFEKLGRRAGNRAGSRLAVAAFACRSRCRCWF